MANAIVWCDIPVKDLDRACKFYSAVLGAKVDKQSMEGCTFGLLPHVQSGVSGCLVESKEVSPSENGPLIYLACDGRLDAAEAVVAANGGKVLKTKSSIGQHGFRTIILDSEGNRVALHSH